VPIDCESCTRKRGKLLSEGKIRDRKDLYDNEDSERKSLIQCIEKNVLNFTDINYIAFF